MGRRIGKQWRLKSKRCYSFAVREPSVVEVDENLRCIEAALGQYGKARLRLVVSVYGPGLDGPRYWTLLGEGGSTELDSLAAVDAFLARLRQLLEEKA